MTQGRASLVHREAAPEVGRELFVDQAHDRAAWIAGEARTFTLMKMLGINVWPEPGRPTIVETMHHGLLRPTYSGFAVAPFPTTLVDFNSPRLVQPRQGVRYPVGYHGYRATNGDGGIDTQTASPYVDRRGPVADFLTLGLGQFLETGFRTPRDMSGTGQPADGVGYAAYLREPNPDAPAHPNISTALAFPNRGLDNNGRSGAYSILWTPLDMPPDDLLGSAYGHFGPEIDAARHKSPLGEIAIMGVAVIDLPAHG